MSVVVSHPFGNANVRAVLRGLEGAGMLERFVTTIGFSDPCPLPSFLGRRSYPVPPKRLATASGREAVRLLARKMGWQGLAAHERGWASVDAIWREVDRRTARMLSSQTRGVYAYEDGALETFREAKRRGIPCFYDLPIGFYQAAQRLFAEERERMPEFAPMLTGLRDSPEKLARKREEIELADVIVSCSPFVRETLLTAGIPEKKIEPVQFGAPAIAPRERSSRIKSKRLRVLFVGRIGQRKGIGYLLRAMKELGNEHFECTLLGEIEGPAEVLKPYAPFFRHLPPRPQREVFQVMAEHDVFVLPSLFEGQALVVLEAMKCGLPGIVTPNTGAAHLIEEGRSGFVVPIRSIEAIVEKLAWCAQNRDAVRAMGEAARTAADALTWADYENKIVQIVRDRL